VNIHDNTPNDTIFSWPGYRNEKTVPHEVRKSGTTAVIIQRQGWQRGDGDWAINVNVLNAAANALSEGRLAQVYVVQAQEQHVLRAATVATVIANIGAARPRDGRWGPYHWLDANFMPVGFNGGVSADDPFM
jgi:hypothetical protein